MYFRVCPHCGCSLDPSESCDCQQERRSEQEHEEWKTLADVRMRDKIQARMREVFQEEMSKNGGNEGKWNVEEVETEE